MSPSSDGSAHARAPHLRLVDEVGADAPARTLIEEGRTLDKLGNRAEARALYERALRSLESTSAPMASMLLRWIASTYEVDADYTAGVLRLSIPIAEKAKPRKITVASRDREERDSRSIRA